MNTPSPACGKAKLHKRKKLLHSDGILEKQKNRITQQNGSLALETSTNTVANVIPNEVTPNALHTQSVLVPIV